MPVFVYKADDLTTAKGCDTVDRWNQARQLLLQEYGASVYIDLLVFPGYTTCAGTPGIDGWHQYGPATADRNFAACPRRWLVLNLARLWEIGNGLWHRAVPGTGPRPLADEHRQHERLQREMSAELLASPASGARAVVTLEGPNILPDEPPYRCTLIPLRYGYDTTARSTP
jgi:hypothetical protein